VDSKLEVPTRAVDDRASEANPSMVGRKQVSALGDGLQQRLPGRRLESPTLKESRTLQLRPGALGGSPSSACPAASTTPSSQGSALSRSTGVLRNGNPEWWVLRQGRNPGDDGADRSSDTDGGDELFEDFDRQFTATELVPTWCGQSPVEPISQRTGWMQRGVFAPLRRHCSGQRRRFDWDGFDLDLAYVTTRVIAMAFPAVGFESAYRNPRSDVVRFLNKYHGDAYRVYNLCEEKSHRCNGFPSEVAAHYPCADHCPPTLTMLAEFCRDVESWMRRHPDNVAVVHCKAGKGRTGTMICALLVYAGAFPSAYDALVWYEGRRGGRRSGVTIPHQIRWIAMLERWLRRGDDGLLSCPMGASRPHRLRTVCFGPLHACFWRSESMENGQSAVLVRIALATRHDVQHHRDTYVYPEVEADVDPDGVVNIHMPLTGPVWWEKDGLLTVTVSRASIGSFSQCVRRKMSLWWHHSFLQRRVVELSGGGREEGRIAPRHGQAQARPTGVRAQRHLQRCLRPH